MQLLDKRWRAQDDHPIKAELGGGFRGAFFNRQTKERVQSERCETLENARTWAKMEAEKRFAEVGYTLAPLRRNGEYQANVWVA